MPGALEAVASRLDARLEPHSGAPLALGLSGGGDSTALLALTVDWAARRGRRIVALTVDHGIQAAGSDWARRCAALCSRLGVEHRTLVWSGDKPRTGLAAAARLARHRLLADAARLAGARVLLLGHTADDRIEAAQMRRAGSTVGDPREWAPSPVWPEGRGLFLLRPMLGLRRAALRDVLRARDLPWIEDPANSDPTSARAVARRDGPEGAASPPTPQEPVDPALEAVPGGGLRHRPALGPVDLRQLSAAVACAGGGEALPRGPRLSDLLGRLREVRPFVASLGGARVEAGPEDLLIGREAGALSRGGTAPVPLIPGAPQVWDGRFELLVSRPGLSVRPLGGAARRLPARETARLKAFGAPWRPTLPLVIGEGVASCPILAQDSLTTVRELVFDRYRAAIGAICREAAIGRVEIGGSNP